MKEIEIILDELIEEARNEPSWKAENALCCAKKEIMMNRNENKEMTNKEAVQIIETAISEVEWEYPMNYAAAFDKAIKALELFDYLQESYEKIKHKIKSI